MSVNAQQTTLAVLGDMKKFSFSACYRAGLAVYVKNVIQITI
jgi:hypothetical protein